MAGNKTTFSALALAMANLFATGAWGEDIDLYVSDAAINAPNAMIFLDNTSNWSNNAQAWRKDDAYRNCEGDTACQSYVEQVFGANSSLTQGQVELAALKLVLNELVCSADPLNAININLGLMMLPPNTGAYTNDAGTAHDPSAPAGVIRRAVRHLDSSTCTSVTGDLDLMFSRITNPDFKAASSANYGAAMFEAFKHFGGYTNPAHAINKSPTESNDGRGEPQGHIHFGPKVYGYPEANFSLTDPGAFTEEDEKNIYRSPIDENNRCAKNFVVLVGNTFPNGDKTSLLSGLSYSYVASDFPFANQSQPRLGDVWAQFLATTDVSPESGQQPVLTYTINVYNSRENTDQSTLLRSMAIRGGTGEDGYYEVNANVKTLVDAFKKIFTSITAVNDVFASSSLPVSVNTQGTYLNQVFIGMFRPDPNSHERWAGNLKQYQFALDTTTTPKTLYLADAQGSAAIDNANTGFISQCAVSFWTSDTSSTEPNGTPYWRNVPTTQTPANTCPAPPAPHSGASPYSDWPDGNIVEKGGAAERLRELDCAAGTSPTYCGRRIQTCTNLACDSVADFNTGNVTLTSSSTSAALVNWLAGGNLGDGPRDDDGNYQTYNFVDNSLAAKPRPTVHGAVVHSRPLAINYGTGTTNDVVVFYGAGDGLLHAVDGNQANSADLSTSRAGRELWAFLAPEFFPAATLTLLDRLRENEPLIRYPTTPAGITPAPARRDYYFDGSIGAYQEIGDSGITHIYLYPSMRRGGRMIYAFDATQRPNVTPPSLMWKFGCPHASNNDTSWNDTECVGGGDVAKIGQTWSTPRVIRIKGSYPLYAVFGGGYDQTCEEAEPANCTNSSKGTGIFVLGATSGVQAGYIDLTAIEHRDSSGAAILPGRVAADVVPVDTDSDGYIDVIYSVDTRGNVWRTNTCCGNDGNALAPADWRTHTYPVAHVSNWNDPAQRRKFFYSPSVITLGDTNIVLLGSGDREHPLAPRPENNTTDKVATTVVNRFYGLRDVYGDPPASVINGIDCDAARDTALTAGCDLLNVTDTSLDYSSAVLAAKGWVIDLDAAGSYTREQIITTPVTIGGYTYFNTFQPVDPSDNSQQCGSLGTARGYAVNFLTGGLMGGAVYRSVTYTGGGMPPSPVAGLVNVGGQTLPFIIGGRSEDGTGGSALEVHTPPIPVNPVRQKIYRYQTIDTE
jgi:type IV pilus assembly protein PilY1